MRSIYDEALEKIDIELDAWDRAEHLELVELVEEALEQAQKQEKLLGLYKKLDDFIVAPNGHHVCRYTDDEKYALIRKQIKELENE